MSVAQHADAAVDRRTASQAYRAHAGRYDQRTRIFHHWREQLIAHLPVEQGATVLDVGCGTGLCLPGLQQKVGPAGRIIGIDASPDMLALAADRIADNGWQNVDLVTAPVDEAVINGTADAALFCAVHDIMQSPAAIANVFGHLRPGAAVAAIGGKWPAPWLWPLRAWVADLHAPFITDFTGFEEPWRLLADHVPNLTVRQLGAGTGYLAYGHTPGT
ncbi:class I SAM-dependent methyltransferase [Nakamurella sp. GG22]